MSTTPPLLSSAEVCDALAIDRSTLSRWVAAGRIACLHKLPGPRGAFVFEASEVARVKAENEKTQAASA